MSNNILFHKIIGNGENHLIIQHGLFGLLDNWGTLGKKFGEHFTVHLLDARNHGRSFHSDEMSHKLMAEDLYNYLQNKNIEKANMIGHSLGGKAVMYFALEHPEMLSHLVIADMSPKAYQPHHLEIIKAIKSLDFEKIEKRSDADTQMKQWIKDVGVRQFILKSLYRNKDGKFALRFNIDSLAKNYIELIGHSLPEKKFYDKTLFLGGEKSNYIQPTDEIIIHRYFPNALISHIKGAGHWLHAEKQNEFFDFVLDFLKS